MQLKPSKLWVKTHLVVAIKGTNSASPTLVSKQVMKSARERDMKGQPRPRLTSSLHPRHRSTPTAPLQRLATYDLCSRHRLFISLLLSSNDSPVVDFDDNTYVTNSAGNFIWKVTVDASIFSEFSLFTKNMGWWWWPFSLRVVAAHRDRHHASPSISFYQ